MWIEFLQYASKTICAVLLVISVYSAYRTLGMFSAWLIYKTDKEDGEFAAKHNLAPVRKFPVWKPLATMLVTAAVAGFLWGLVTA